MFSFQGSRGLWEPDEGRYTAVALEMGRLGNYVTPHLHHEVKHLSKPPLTYWLLAASLKSLGGSEWALRIPNALAFLGTILLVARMGKRLAPGSPALAPLIYATCLLPFAAANVITTDTLLTLWETLAVYGFVELWWGEDDRRELHRTVMWLGFGLAFLTKGPPGLLPLLAIVVLAVSTEGARGIGKLVSPVSLLAFGGVGLSWYLLLWLRQPADLEYLIRYEVLARIFTPVHDRNASWYGPLVIYVPSLLLGSLPWTGRIFGAWRDAWRSSVRRSGGRDPVSLFLLSWIVLSLVILSVARSRMHLYVLPLFVPMALLAARRQTAFSLSARRRLGLALWVVFLIGLRASAALLPTGKDSRVLAQAIDDRVHGPIDEVVFVDTLPRYGLSFYLGTEVEAVTLESLRGELQEEEGSRLFILSRKHSADFDELSRTLGFTALPLGSWRELV
ncbi:MAG TPA: glycosyltransferase family 39 protein, partial [Thermoanaerobaculia bacterium]|nr:glycosyltransferase family 39 protein [Thermoanaerobaculia bacterium]